MEALGERAEIRISDLNFAIRTLNCLTRADIHTVGDLVKNLYDKESGLLGIRNLGTKSAGEILRYLKDKGVRIPEQYRNLIEDNG